MWLIDAILVAIMAFLAFLGTCAIALIVALGTIGFLLIVFFALCGLVTGVYGVVLALDCFMRAIPD